MKILIVSDTHKMHKNLERVLKIEAPIDLMIHLGDSEGYEDEIAQMAGCRLEIISGNNDFFSSLDSEKELRIGRYKILMTHGHYYYVTMGVEDIKREARGRNADIVMFGHTHRPLIQYGKDLIAMNPGSISFPRQQGRRPSYILMELNHDGEAHFALKYL